MDRRLLTLDESAAYVGVHRKTVGRWIKSGALRAYHAGPRLVRVDLAELDAMLLSAKLTKAEPFTVEQKLAIIDLIREAS